MDIIQNNLCFCKNVIILIISLILKHINDIFGKNYKKIVFFCI